MRETLATMVFLFALNALATAFLWILRHLER